MTTGKRIAELRKSKGYTQEYIADRLGVSRQAVSKWEQDMSSPDTKNLIALAAILQSSIEYIAIGTKPQEVAAVPIHKNLEIQRILLERKINNRQYISYCLALGAIMLFFCFAGIFTLVSISMLIAAAILYITTRYLKKDLEFLNENSD